MKTTTKILIFLIAMALADIIIPVPIAAFMLIYVFYQRPPWFKDLLEEVYDLELIERLSRHAPRGERLRCFAEISPTVFLPRRIPEGSPGVKDVFFRSNCQSVPCQ